MKLSKMLGRSLQGILRQDNSLIVRLWMSNIAYLRLPHSCSEVSILLISGSGGNRATGLQVSAGASHTYGRVTLAFVPAQHLSVTWSCFNLSDHRICNLELTFPPPTVVLDSTLACKSRISESALVFVVHATTRHATYESHPWVVPAPDLHARCTVAVRLSAARACG